MKIYANDDPRFYEGWTREELLEKIFELQRGLRAQQGAINDTARIWEKIGYDKGKADGFDEAMKAP